MTIPQAAKFPSLANKTVLITGGGSGIGAAITRGFAAQGARVAVLDLVEDSAKTLVREIAGDRDEKIDRGGEGDKAAKGMFLRCDLREVAALQAAVAKVGEQLGDVGVLVNNAGNDDRHVFEDVTPAYWDERMAVNARHMFFAAQAVLPQMKRLGGGSIVNMGSIIWRLKHAGSPVYNTAKASVNGLTGALARELGAFGIRVNTVSPGAVWTERQIKLWFTPEFERQVMAGQCLKERVMPEDVANMVLFLASDAAARCSGQDFVVDAGWS
jgi:NAD(P)-dependent dehydrogenase (short-subunit alcohol dehydrogenase family)